MNLYHEHRHEHREHRRTQSCLEGLIPVCRDQGRGAHPMLQQPGVPAARRGVWLLSPFLLFPSFTQESGEPALSAGADIAPPWRKTTWRWAGSHRHTLGNFPFWQVTNASVSFPLPKAYTLPYFCARLATAKPPYFAEKTGRGNRDQEAKAFSKREAQEPVQMSENKASGEVLPLLFSNKTSLHEENSMWIASKLFSRVRGSFEQQLQKETLLLLLMKPAT